MPDSTPRRPRRQIEAPRTRLARADGLAFADILPADRVAAALRAEGVGWRHKVFTPVVTLWAFLAQVVGTDRCCRAAVARVAAWLVSRGRPTRATTGGYCKARARLPEGLPRRLTRDVGRTLHRPTGDGWRWRGR